MPGRSRRVYFEDEEPGPSARRTRGLSSHRSRSADRVHSIFDDLPSDMQGPRVVGRDAYNEVLRQNEYLRSEVRELQQAQAWIPELERQNAELKRENRELRRTTAVDYASDNNANNNEARKEHSKLRKKYAKLEAEAVELKSRLAEWKKKALDYKELYENASRHAEDANRRLETYRKSYTVLETTNSSLAEEVAALKRRLEIEQRANYERRRSYWP
ncbi:uncharacterized protein B0T15DRAFT_494523 [Chaetomium strumarium]|uniref:Uncharacterized protein n=1 Tax=Chaetomium strumarium TaxID=1170767 RepID=A0AAJ0GQG7_9PEZI|nr:hypothetical protein B0T15DRAFT_494523 [Chaetomium strumarium]